MTSEWIISNTFLIAFILGGKDKHHVLAGMRMVTKVPYLPFAVPSFTEPSV